MVIKIVGAVIIIAATSLIGIEFAARFERRKSSIADFIAALSMLESEVIFALNPLYKAFSTIASHLDNRPTGLFFAEVSAQLEANSIRVSETWRNLLAKHEKLLYLHKQDIEILNSFASRLGKTDSDNQIKSIRHTVAQLNIQLEQAGKACDKNKKVYQSFGVLSGILIAILLF